MKITLPIDALQDIWHFATRKHDGQKYGGAEQGEQIEYLNHIAGVTFEIINASIASNEMDVDLALKCAVLHDTIEDTNTTYEEISQRFGTKVADGVLALTKDPSIEGKREKMLDSLQRIKKQPKEIWAVKLADRIVNLYLPPYYWTNEKKQAYVDEALFIHEHLHEGNSYLAKRLSMKIEAYKQFIK